MKKFKFSLAVALAIVAAIATSAFTQKDSGTEKLTDPLHWFDAQTGEYLGLKTLSFMQTNVCGGDDQDCAHGYRQITEIPDEDPVPVVNTYETTLEEEIEP